MNFFRSSRPVNFSKFTGKHLCQREGAGAGAVNFDIPSEYVALELITEKLNYSLIRNRSRISLQILSEFMRINYLIFPLKSSENLSDDFRLRPATLFKKRLWHSCFLVNFAKILETPLCKAPPDDCFCIYQTSAMMLLAKPSKLSERHLKVLMP